MWIQVCVYDDLTGNYHSVSEEPAKGIEICEYPQPLLRAAILKETVFFIMLIYQRKKKVL